MTRKEAVANLNMISVAFVEPVTKEQRKLIDDTFDMAIEALEQETYNDAISRQAVIEQTYNWSKDEFLRVTNPFDYLRKRINSLPSVKPQEPFNIETYCKEHFCVMVDKDVWERLKR